MAIATVAFYFNHDSPFAFLAHQRIAPMWRELLGFLYASEQSSDRAYSERVFAARWLEGKDIGVPFFRRLMA